jgi:hypothetical protein
MKNNNASYFQQTAFIKPRFKYKAVKPKQINLFYLKTMKADFSLLNKEEKLRLVKDINRLFKNDLMMIEYWANKLNCSVKLSAQCVELIIP